MANICPKCGEKLFPTDTFCGFCGATIENAIPGVGDKVLEPRSLVGDDALSREEREKIEKLKKYIAQNPEALERYKAKEAAKNFKKPDIVSEIRAEQAAKEADNADDDDDEVSPEDMERILAERAAASAEKVEDESDEIGSDDAVESTEDPETDAKDDAETGSADDSKTESEDEEIDLTDDEIGSDEAAAPAESESTGTDEIVLPDSEMDGMRYSSYGQTDIAELEAQLKSAEEEAKRLEDATKKANLEAILAREKADRLQDEKLGLDDNFVSNVKSARRAETPGDIWEESSNRASEAQKEFEREERKRKYENGPEHFKRDVILLAAGIIILIVLLCVLIKDDVKKLKGNDAIEKASTSSVANNETVVTPEPTSAVKEVVAWDGRVADGFESGDGSQAAPYTISDASQLAFLASEVNRGMDFTGVYFELSNDIDLNNKTWTPAGYFVAGSDGNNLLYAFTGHFDGKNYKISNLNISDAASLNLPENAAKDLTLGLFGAVKNAEVKNVTVENASIGVKTESGEVYAAVLAGYSDASDIAYCSVNGTVKIEGNERVIVSALLGAAVNTVVNSGNSIGSIEAVNAGENADIGLLAGYAEDFSATGTTVTGDITVNSAGVLKVGGVSGYRRGGTFTDLNVTADITASSTSQADSSCVGGIVGEQYSAVDSGCTVSSKITTNIFFEARVGGGYGYSNDSKSEKATVDTTIVSTLAGTKTYNITGGFKARGVNDTDTGITVTGSVTVVSEGSGFAGGLYGYLTGGNYAGTSSAKLDVQAGQIGYTGGVASMRVGDAVIDGCTGTTDITVNAENTVENGTSI